MLFCICLYFIMMSGLLALLCLASARHWTVQWIRHLTWGGRSVAVRAAIRASHHSTRAANSTIDWVYGVIGWAVRQRRGLALTLLALVGTPLLAVILRGWQELDGYDHTMAHPIDDRVASLLHGEQLVAPSMLPPELFSTHEVEQARPFVYQASRQWELLDGDFRRQVLLVFKIMREQHGYDMILLEGYRSPERQALLASLEPHVTRAGAYQSLHQFGLAVDCAFMKNGRIVVSEVDPWAAHGFALYGEIARSVGLTWGGGWRHIRDLGHVESSHKGVLPTRNGLVPATSLAI